MPPSPPPKTDTIHLCLRNGKRPTHEIIEAHLSNNPGSINDLVEVNPSLWGSKNQAKMKELYKKLHKRYRSREKVSALYDAAMRNDFASVEFLLDHGADPKVRNLAAFWGRGWEEVDGFGQMYPLAPFPRSAVETVRAWDAMMVSWDERIRALAEVMAGEMGELDGHGHGSEKKAMESRGAAKVSKKKEKKQTPGQKSSPKMAAKRRQSKYDLRARNPNVSYT